MMYVCARGLHVFAVRSPVQLVMAVGCHRAMHTSVLVAVAYQQKCMRRSKSHCMRPPAPFVPSSRVVASHAVTRPG